MTVAMAHVEIRDDGIIECTGDNGNKVICDPLSHYCLGQHCGNCPAIRFGERFTKELFGTD